MKKITGFLILGIVLFYTNGFAQVNYGFSATTRAYVPVSCGITPPFINIPYDYNLDVAASWDEGLGDSIPIGFTFNYNGVNHNYINIDANGFATLCDPKSLLGVVVENYYINSLRVGPFTIYPYIGNDTYTNVDSNLL